LEHLSSESREYVVIVVLLSSNEPKTGVSFVAKAGVYITFHPMEKVQIIHQLVENVASTALQKLKKMLNTNIIRE
jgi:hypothetical protein